MSLHSCHCLASIHALMEPCLPQGLFQPNPGVRGHGVGWKPMQREEWVLDWEIGVRGHMCLHRCSVLVYSFGVRGRMNFNL